MPLAELKSNAGARAQGTSTIKLGMRTNHGARAEGTGLLFPLADMHSDAGARAEGVGTITGTASLRSNAGARAAGSGFPNKPPPPPRVSDKFFDLWFYGATRVKSMTGVGAASAAGEGIIT